MAAIAAYFEAKSLGKVGACERRTGLHRTGVAHLGKQKEVWFSSAIKI